MVIQTVVYWTILISKKHYKMITIDLSKQQAVDAAPKAIQPINFTGNLDQGVNTTRFFILEEAKETIFDKELWEYCKCVPQFILL